MIAARWLSLWCICGVFVEAHVFSINDCPRPLNFMGGGRVFAILMRDCAWQPCAIQACTRVCVGGTVWWSARRTGIFFSGGLPLVGPGQGRRNIMGAQRPDVTPRKHPLESACPQVTSWETRFGMLFRPCGPEHLRFCVPRAGQPMWYDTWV